MNGLKTAMLLSALTALFMGLGYMFGGSGGAIIALLVAAGMNFFTYWNADKIVLSMHNARQVDAQSAPDFYTLVEDLARRANMPMPKVYIVEDANPNAFATGRNPENAAVAATTGLLSMLSRDEVAGVMAHELGHVRNRDTLIMTMVATIAGAISMIANFALFFRGGGNENSPNPLAAILAVVVAPFAAMIVQMAISRTREYGADRAGAEICGNPRALASALQRISAPAQRIPNHTAERNPAAAQLYIVPTAVSNLFSTHPATEKRISALMALEAEAGTRSRPGAYDSLPSAHPMRRTQEESGADAASAPGFGSHPANRPPRHRHAASSSVPVTRRKRDADASSGGAAHQEQHGRRSALNPNGGQNSRD